MSMQGNLNGEEQWCPVKGGAAFKRCLLLEVSLYIQGDMYVYGDVRTYV